MRDGFTRWWDILFPLWFLDASSMGETATIGGNGSAISIDAGNCGFGGGER